MQQITPQGLDIFKYNPVIVLGLSLQLLPLLQNPQFLGVLTSQSRGFAASSESTPERSVSLDGEKDSLATDLEQATGLER